MPTSTLRGRPPGSKTLVIVSALATGASIYPVMLKATPTESNTFRRTATAVDLPAREPEAVALTPPPPALPTDARPPTFKRFHVLVRDGDVASASNYLDVAARLAAVGKRVQIYVDERDCNEVDETTLRTVVATFDEQIYPVAARRFGPVEDTDRDGRFTIFMTGWLKRLSGGRVKVDGYVRGADFDLDLGAPFGNRCDMMYLSTALKSSPHLKTVLAHEYTHAVTYSRKAFPRDASGRLGVEEEGWLDEGVAHLVEDVHGFSRSNLDYRVSAFLSRPEQYRLIVEDYYTAGLFRSHGSRGGTYLFLRWCVDRHGDVVLDRLIRSGLRGVANLEAATGQSFASLYREWSAALFLSGLDPEGDASIPSYYRAIDPRGTFDAWVLAGPRSTRVVAGGPGEAWTSAGTSSHYAVIESVSPNPVRVEVTGPANAKLQVTAVTLPDGLGGIELDVRAATGRSEGALKVMANVAARGSTPIRLGAIVWEPLIPPADAHDAGFHRAGLDMLGIARGFGTSLVAPEGRLATGLIRLDGVHPGDGPIVFKAVGTDAAGRRVAAWAELSFEPGHREEGVDVLERE